MDRASVDHVFAGFERKVFKDPQWQAAAGFGSPDMHSFRTNTQPAMRVEYEPTGTSVFQRVEACDVYFDTNGVIIAFCYGGS
jgi:hypothetical protein